MPTPSERIENIIASHIPSKVVFKSRKTTDNQSVFLDPLIVEERRWTNIDDDSEFHLALMANIEESWDSEHGCYYISASPDKLWYVVKNTIIRQYEKVSLRCNATKRKTEMFIRDISLENKALANYLITVFTTISSSAWLNKDATEQEALFKQFESLRRTYGKRSR